MQYSTSIEDAIKFINQYFSRQSYSTPEQSPFSPDISVVPGWGGAAEKSLKADLLFSRSVARVFNPN
jgi:hypothetical protein